MWVWGEIEGVKMKMKMREGDCSFTAFFSSLHLMGAIHNYTEQNSRTITITQLKIQRVSEYLRFE